MSSALSESSQQSHSIKADYAAPFEKHFGYQLRRTAVLMQADLSLALKDMDFIPATAAIMQTLASKQNMIQIELAKKLGLQRTNISPMIFKLEKRELLQRFVVDGRSQSLQLTELGLDQVKQIQDAYKKHASNCLSMLTKSDLSKLDLVIKSSLQKLNTEVSQPENDDNNDQLSYKIQRTSALAMSKLGKSLEPLELTPVLASLILMVSENPGILQNKLGRKLGIKRTNTSIMVSRLKSRSLLDTQENGRTQSLSLTAEGTILVSKIEGILDAHEQACFGHLNGPEKNNAISSLRTIRQQLIAS